MYKDCTLPYSHSNCSHRITSYNPPREHINGGKYLQCWTSRHQEFIFSTTDNNKLSIQAVRSVMLNLQSRESEDCCVHTMTIKIQAQIPPNASNSILWQQACRLLVYKFWIDGCCRSNSVPEYVIQLLSTQHEIKIPFASSWI